MPEASAHLQPGRHGRADGPAGLSIVPMNDRAIAVLAARKNRRDDLVVKIAADHGVTLEDAPRVSGAETLAFVGLGPGKWLAVAAGRDGGEFARELCASCDGLASVADLSDAYTLLGLGGPRLGDVLAKGLPVDLHPASFGPDDALTSTFGHVRVTLWHPTAGQGYVLAAPRSLFGSLLHHLLASAAEFGCEIVPVAAG